MQVPKTVMAPRPTDRMEALVKLKVTAWRKPPPRLVQPPEPLAAMIAPLSASQKHAITISRTRLSHDIMHEVIT